jgi:hypothetical protein
MIWRAFFSALFAALREYLHDQKLQRDYEDALVENAKFDALARERAGADATRERMRNAEPMASDDDGALRDWLRSRDPETK